MNVGIGAVSIAPFVVLSVACVPSIDASRWLETPDGPYFGLGTVKWKEYMNILFWNLNYWDHSASFAGEVVDPGATFPRASLWAVLLVALGYLLPLLATIGATSSDVTNSSWTNGQSETVAEAVAGKWLKNWIVLAAGIANVGLFQAEMSSDSFQLLGMAERGMLPSVFARRR